MKLEHFNSKQEATILGITALLMIISFQIAFFNEGLGTVIHFVLGAMWVLVIPGYFLLYSWKNKITLLEHLVFGTLLAVAFEGVLAYYLGLFGMLLGFQVFFLPMLTIVLGLGLAHMRGSNANHHKESHHDK